MPGIKIYITGAGVISAAGKGLEASINSVKNNTSRIKPITIIDTGANPPLPAGEVTENFDIDEVPRTHRLALTAAEEALSKRDINPDGIVIGVTTGGMFDSEEFLKDGIKDKELYHFHGTGTVARYLARKTKCIGPVITVSTACSSGTAAIKIAIELIRCGISKRVLAGGADSLCKLTYYGFNSLQLIDPKGARPFDADRKGMSVAEGAGMLLIEAADSMPEFAIAEILGAGLSCDAYHPVAPHPEGDGALAAMEAAVKDAGIDKYDISYINLHGTGTIDNDRSEARAVKRMFGSRPPLMSSIKGLTGHSLAASGAIEAVICSQAIQESIVPANTGCVNPDQGLEISPLLKPEEKSMDAVLSNSLGFGGNNASLIIAKKGRFNKKTEIRKLPALRILGSSCITGAGDFNDTMSKISSKGDARGITPTEIISLNLPAQEVRRLKRLPRMVLALACDCLKQSGLQDKPEAVYYGTGWGSLTETNDFLSGLFKTDDQFASPTDFVGSVHNAPAGHLSIKYGARGPCITTTGCDYSIEQALISACVLSDRIGTKSFLIGADEYHEELTPLFDKSAAMEEIPSDGGGAFILEMSNEPGVYLYPAFNEISFNNPDWMLSLIKDLGGVERIRDGYGAIFAGIPGVFREKARTQLSQFLNITGFKGRVIDYRKFTGEHASAASVAAVMSHRFVLDSKIPKCLTGSDTDLDGKGILLLGLGGYITAVEIFNKK